MMSLHMLMIDTVEAQAMLSLQTSLRSVGSLLELHNQPPQDGQYGFCAVIQTGKGVTLQVCSRAARAALPDSQHSSMLPDVVAAPAF